MRHRELFFRSGLILSIPRSSGRISPLIFQNHGAQDAPLDEILNGCIVDRKNFSGRSPWTVTRVFAQSWLLFEGFSRLVCQVFCQQDGPIDEILFEDTLESVFKWRPSRIPRNKYLGSRKKVAG